MRTIHADITVRTEDHCIPLSPARLRELCIRSGDQVRVAGGDMEVEARVELRSEGPVAVPQWDTLTYRD
jgi:hypothetical protein